jgi:hypothetical protein
MLGKYRTDLLLLLHNLPLLIMLHVGINALHGDAPSILFPTSLNKTHAHSRILSTYFSEILICVNVLPYLFTQLKLLFVNL